MNIWGHSSAQFQRVIRRPTWHPNLADAATGNRITVGKSDALLARSRDDGHKRRGGAGAERIPKTQCHGNPPELSD